MLASVAWDSAELALAEAALELVAAFDADVLLAPSLVDAFAALVAALDALVAAFPA